MARRDYASQKSHAYRAPRKTIRRDKLKKEVIRKRLKIGISIFSIFGLLASIVYWIFFSYLFTINKITVAGEKGENHIELLEYTQDYLSWKILFVLPQSNYYLFDLDKLLIKLESRDYTPAIYDFEIYQDWPHSLSIKFKRRIAYLKVITIRYEMQPIVRQVDTGEEDLPEEAVEEEEIEIKEIFLIDSAGIIVTEDVLDNEIALPEINLMTKTRFKSGQMILSRDAIDKVVKIFNMYSKHELPSIKNFEISEDFKKFVMNTVGYEIYFSFDYPLQTQMDNLLLSLEKIGDRVGKLQYIDMRIENRAYVCCELGEF